MAISYVLSFNPKWYFADLTGRALGAGYIAFFNNINRTQQLLVYQDGAGNFPWPTSTVPNVGVQGVLIDENGTQGPFYFISDTSDPTETYYIEVYDSSGNLQWTQENFFPPSGGGGSITEAVELDNLIVNNSFYRNIGSVAPLPVFDVIAPSVHTGFTKTTSNAGPDVIFVKNNTSATDALSFPTFKADGTTLNGDITPYNFMRYVCSVAGSSETSKFIQFPINAQVQNLSNQEMIGSIWARCNSGNNQIQVQVRQFYGDGSGAHADVDSLQTTLTLSNTWQKFNFSGSTGDVTGNGIGACGNDGTFLQINLPLDATTSIDIVKPTLFFGNILPNETFETYEDITSKVDDPRTGDIRVSLNAHAPFGWVNMDDGTIGNASSNATNRANLDTFPLFNEIWTQMQGSQGYAPMYTSAGVATAYGATAIADFQANNQISLTKALAAVFAGIPSVVPPSQTFTANHLTGQLTVTNATQFGTAVPVAVFVSGGGALPTGLAAATVYYSIFVDATHIKLASSIANALAGTALSFSDDGTPTLNIILHNAAIGTYVGEETHVQTVSELAAHTHNVLTNNDTSSNSTVTKQGSGGGAFNTATSSTGSSTPFNVMQPTVYMNVFMKL